MERIYTFLPSVLMLACIASSTLLYMKWIVKHFGDNLKSVKWQKNNQWKVICTISTPNNVVRAPAVEELIFRAPLIIAFSAISPVAWYGILASSILFALMHWFGKKIDMSDIQNNQQSDDVTTEVNRIHAEKGRMILVQKTLHVIFTLPLGILIGYCGIKYQSIWVAFAIHSAWNLIMPTILPFLLMLLLIFFLLLITLIRNSIAFLNAVTWGRVMKK